MFLCAFMSETSVFWKLPIFFGIVTRPKGRLPFQPVFEINVVITIGSVAKCLSKKKSVTVPQLTSLEHYHYKTTIHMSLIDNFLYFH